MKAEWNPTVLLTGGARGLGPEVARQLAAQGARVVVSARRRDAAAAAAAELRDAGEVTALACDLDVADPASVAAAREAFEAEHEVLDVLINNAAAYVSWGELPSEPDFEAAHAALETNLFGAWRMTSTFLPLLRRSAHPRVVNVSSGAGSHGDPAFGLTTQGGTAPAYGISKAALNALTSKLAAELEGTAVIVNSVCPGLTATFPGAQNMGARSVQESAGSVIWAVSLPDDGPRGGFFRDGRPLPW